MLFAYEVRVLLARLFAAWLTQRAATAQAAAEAAADVCVKACVAAKGGTGNIHTDIVASSLAMKAVDRQQVTEARWEWLQAKADAANARYALLDGRAGRTVPGLLGTVQAWAMAAVLTWKCPSWGADLVALFW